MTVWSPSLLRARFRTAMLLLMAAVLLTAASPQARAQNPHRTFNVLPIVINSVTAVTDPVTGLTSLVANGTLGGTPFTAPVTLAPGGSNGACPILNLKLGAINLNLLGLDVATSPICLAITAVPGSGNLLGNLLCDVANLLNGPLTLSQVLNSLSSAQLTQLLNGITGLLNGVLNLATSSNAFAGISGTSPGACDILNLSLGPVNLNLLGLNVHLDNCNNGPVTVDITAIPGAGNLLGNLLCGVAHLLDTHASPIAILAHLEQIAQIIQGLI